MNAQTIILELDDQPLGNFLLQHWNPIRESWITRRKTSRKSLKNSKVFKNWKFGANYFYTEKRFYDYANFIPIFRKITQGRVISKKYV